MGADNGDTVHYPVHLVFYIDLAISLSTGSLLVATNKDTLLLSPVPWPLQVTCREPDSNRYGKIPGDFKSPASAIPPSRPASRDYTLDRRASVHGVA